METDEDSEDSVLGATGAKDRAHPVVVTNQPGIVEELDGLAPATNVRGRHVGVDVAADRRWRRSEGPPGQEWKVLSPFAPLRLPFADDDFAAFRLATAAAARRRRLEWARAAAHSACHLRRGHWRRGRHLRARRLLLEDEPALAELDAAADSRLKPVGGGGSRLAALTSNGLYIHDLTGDVNDVNAALRVPIIEGGGFLDFSVSDDGDAALFALRRRRAVWVAYAASGEVRCRWDFARDTSCCAALPALYAVAAVDTAGTVGLYSYESGERVSAWEDALAGVTGPSGWSTLLPSSSTPSVLRVAGRRAVAVFDLRTRDGLCGKTLCDLSDSAWPGERICWLCASYRSGNCFYCTSSHRIMLLDERRMSSLSPHGVVRSWPHHLDASTVRCCAIPSEIPSATPRGSEGNEVVVVYGDSAMQVSLLSTSDRANGRVTALPAARPDLKTRSARESTLLSAPPVAGMAVTAVDNDSDSLADTFNIMALDAIGTLWRCRIGTTDHSDAAEPTFPNIEIPAEPTFPNFEIPEFAKSAVTTAVHRRTAESSSTGLARSMPVVKQVNPRLVRSLAGESLGKRGARRERPNRYWALPFLRPVDMQEHSDRAAARVFKIFSGEGLFPHLSGSGSDTAAHEPARLLAGARKKTRKMAPAKPQLPLERDDYMLRAFLSDLDQPGRTSTQQEESCPTQEPRQEQEQQASQASTAANTTLGSTRKSVGRKKKKVVGF